MFMAMVAMGGQRRQVTFGAAGTGAAFDASTPVAVPYPADIVAGSFLLLHVVAVSSGIANPAIATPSGWTEIDSRQISLAYRSSVFRKRAVGDESGSLDVTFSDADGGAAGRMYRFSHGSGTEAASGAADASGDTTATAINVTTTVPKAMAVQAIFVANNTTVAAITGESNADYAEAVAEYAQTGATLSLQVAEVDAAAAITGGTATVGTSSLDIVHGFAIKP